MRERKVENEAKKIENRWLHLVVEGGQRKELPQRLTPEKGKKSVGAGE